MDFNIQKLLDGQNNNNGEADDRISELPDSLLHYILSFLLDIKHVARTSVLSKRWTDVWKSIPSLVFPCWSHPNPPLSPEINKFMDSVDRALLLRDPSSSIKKFSLDTYGPVNESRLHSWISSLTKHNVEELILSLELDRPFCIPTSLFTCESLIRLELYAITHLPKSFRFPKLKTLELCGITFTEDNSWNEQHFSNCPVLKNLKLEECTWFGVRKFCILIQSLQKLELEHESSGGNGLQDCDLKIYAPSLVYLTYWDCVAKDYNMSSFQTLTFAQVSFDEYDQPPIGYGAALTKFFQAISHVKNLKICAAGLQRGLHLDADNFVNDLPTFHSLNELHLSFGPVTNKLIFALIKSAPNLQNLEFNHQIFIYDNGDDDIVYDENKELFRHLQSVSFRPFSGDEMELRWAKFILRNAKSLQTMTIANYYFSKEKTEVLRSELISVQRVSQRCVFKFALNFQ